MDYIKIQEKGWQTLSKADVVKIFKENLVKLGQDWGKIFLPLRFLPMGDSRYHLAKRKSKYIKATLKKFPNWRPLVKTGNLANCAINNWRSSSAGSDKAKVVIQRPHPTTVSPINVSEELLSINKNEVKPLLDEFKDRTLKDFSKGGSKSEVSNNG